jgi:hypothetical protein
MREMEEYLRFAESGESAVRYTEAQSRDSTHADDVA